MSAVNTMRTLPQRSVVNVKRIQGASRHLAVIPHDPEQGLYLVESATQPGQLYDVAVERDRLAGHCTCPWAQHGGMNCKHVLAALRAHFAAQGSLSFWPTSADARRQHRPLVVGERIYATLRRGR